MAVRVLTAAVLSAALMFVWGFLFWGLSGIPARFMKPLPESAEVDITAVLRRDKVPSGVYVYPMPANPQDADARKAAEDKYRAGPRFQLAHKLEGGEPMAPATLAAGYVHMLAVSLAAAVLTALALPALPSFGRRFLFVALASVLGVLWTSPGDVVWWSHSPAYCLGEMAYGLIGGLLMAAVISGIVKPAANS